jgi:hypothetical protein
MLDWSLYNNINKNKYPDLSLEQRIEFEKFFRKLENDKKGVCYPGGNDAHIIIRIPNDGIGIKVYKDNLKKNKELMKFHLGIRDLIYKDHEHIQKVYEFGKIDNITYARQEWVNGDTLKEKYNKRSIKIEDIERVLDDLYMKIIIPLWGRGVIWKDGCLANLCLGERLVMIDTDNMYKTAYEILEGNSYKLRNSARILNRDAHLDIFYDMSNCIRDIGYYELKVIWDKYMAEIYNGDIDGGWVDRSLEGFNGFKSEFLKMF